MYASNVGRAFLNAYNQKSKNNYNAKTFFEEVFIPLFFDHPKYMMTAGNSPLENPKLSWEDMIKGKKTFESPEQRQERISKMINKIETEKADASIAIGYAVLDTTAGTSGQITNIELPDNKEDIYLSWIGAGLGIGVEDNITILFEYEQLLLDVFDGWKYYRDYLERTPLMKGNQINTWNGHWISHLYGYSFDKSDPIYGMNPLEKTKEDLFNLPTINWIKVLLGISLQFSQNNLTGYLYNIGKSNTTIGFIPFIIQDIRKPNQFYERIFGKSSFLHDIKLIENLYGTAFGLRTACQNGSIGVQAMEPNGIRAFFSTGKGTKKISYNENDEKQRITFNTYLIWILAMLNNEKLWDTSREIAQRLIKYKLSAEKSRTNRKTDVENLLSSTTSKQFLLNLIPIIEEEKEVGDFEELGKLVHLMPKDNFPYFNTLIRFQYALLNK